MKRREMKTKVNNKYIDPTSKTCEDTKHESTM